MGERKRDPYAEVGTRQRLARDRAIAAGATMRQLSVLAAVDYWVASYSWFGQHVSLPRIAVKARIWKGTEETCPEWAARRASEDLTWLDETAGAIDYRPGGQKGGPRVSRVSYRPPSSTAQGSAGTTPEQHSSGVDDHDPRADQLTTPEQISSRPLSRSARERASTPEQLSSPTRGSSEDSSEEGVRGTRARPATTHAGNRAADRLTSFAPVASDPEEIVREAQRVVEIAGRIVDVGVLLEALDDRDDPGTPAELLTWFAEWLGDGDNPHEQTAGAELLPIAHAFPVATVIADACTLTSGKPWTAHFDEAVRLAQHWQRHAYPEGVTAGVLAEIRHDGIRHPGDADELARQAILELGTTPPKKFARALASARKTA